MCLAPGFRVTFFFNLFFLPESSFTFPQCTVCTFVDTIWVISEVRSKLVGHKTKIKGCFDFGDIVLVIKHLFLSILTSHCKGQCKIYRNDKFKWLLHLTTKNRNICVYQAATLPYHARIASFCHLQERYRLTALHLPLGHRYISREICHSCNSWKLGNPPHFPACTTHGFDL